MTKHQLNKFLLFVLIIAFLSMQSAAAHIHLAEHHDHDGSHHQHYSKTHTHQSIYDHDDTIDFSHQVDHANIVELDHEFNTVKNNKPKNTCAAMDAPTLRQPPAFQPLDIKLPLAVNTKLSHLYRSAVYLRAPPKSS